MQRCHSHIHSRADGTAIGSVLGFCIFDMQPEPVIEPPVFQLVVDLLYLMSCSVCIKLHAHESNEPQIVLRGCFLLCCVVCQNNTLK